MKLDVNYVKSIYKPKVRPIIWNDKENVLELLDQRKLPFEEIYVINVNEIDVAKSIREMVVRGAPAIGIAAAYGMVLALTSRKDKLNNLNEALKVLQEAATTLRSARPTAINLPWAVERMLNKAKQLVENGLVKSINELIEELKMEAHKILNEEFEAEILMGIYGLEKINDGDTILTQCNAGGLATGTGLGTALAPIKIAHCLGIKVSMIVPETRPWLQGARLTVYELIMEGIPVKLITDTAVGYVMYRGMVNSVMVGADRILSDGHVFNKIGTFKEAVIAHELGIPFYVIAPTSSFDLKSKVNDVEIEERDPNEVRMIFDRYITMKDVPVLNPVFDITPPKYITAIITEKGIIYPPYDKNIPKVLQKP